MSTSPNNNDIFLNVLNKYNKSPEKPPAWNDNQYERVPVNSFQKQNSNSNALSNQNVLTDEQLRRIEENKRRAQQKQQIKQNSTALQYNPHQLPLKKDTIIESPSNPNYSEPTKGQINVTKITPAYLLNNGTKRKSPEKVSEPKVKSPKKQKIESNDLNKRIGYYDFAQNSKTPEKTDDSTVSQWVKTARSSISPDIEIIDVPEINENNTENIDKKKIEKKKMTQGSLKFETVTCNTNLPKPKMKKKKTTKPNLNNLLEKKKQISEISKGKQRLPVKKKQHNIIIQKSQQIPDEFTDVLASEESWSYFESKTENSKRVSWGIVYRQKEGSLTTNFRIFEKKKEEQNAFDSATALVFLFQDEPEVPFWLDLKTRESPIKPSKRWNLWKEFINSTSIVKICYNTQESIRPLYFQYGSASQATSPQSTFDPLLAAWILNPDKISSSDNKSANSSWVGLLNINKKHYDKTKKELGHSFKDQKLFTNSELPLNLLHLDLRSCLILGLYFAEKFSSRYRKLGTAYSSECSVSHVLSRMEVNGIAYHEKVYKEMEQKTNQKISELTKEAEEIVGEKINLASTKDVTKALFETLGVSHAGLTKTSGGKISVADSNLNIICKRYTPEEMKFPYVLKEHRKLSKLKSTYMATIKARARESRIHTKWCQTKTATGRLSSQNPNLQNFPKKSTKFTLKDTNETYEINVRNTFACQKGWIFIDSDYAQKEMRILAHMSDDEKLKQYFENKDSDFMKCMAAEIHEIHFEEVSESQRDKTKRLMYGLMYGMGTHSLSKMLNCSLQHAEDFIKALFKKFPKLKIFIEEKKREMLQDKNHTIETLNHRRRKFVIKTGDITSQRRAERQAISSIIQGSAADLIKVAMRMFEREVKTESYVKENMKLVLQIHDELVFEVKEDFKDKAIQIIKKCMTQGLIADLISVPLEINTFIGDSWGSVVQQSEAIQEIDYDEFERDLDSQNY